MLGRGGSCGHSAPSALWEGDGMFALWLVSAANTLRSEYCVEVNTLHLW